MSITHIINKLNINKMTEEIDSNANFTNEVKEPNKNQWKIETKIRKRKSYEFWMNLYNEGKYSADQLRIFHSELSQCQMYGSSTRAGYSKESLELFIKDTFKN